MEISVADFVVRLSKVSASGRIDAFTVAELTDQFDQLLADGATNFIIDLAQVTFLDSAGIAALVSLLKKARKRGGDVKLVWPAAAEAQRIFRLTRFDKVFVMYESADAALAAGGITA